MKAAAHPSLTFANPFYTPWANLTVFDRLCYCQSRLTDHTDCLGWVEGLPSAASRVPGATVRSGVERDLKSNKLVSLSHVIVGCFRALRRRELRWNVFTGVSLRRRGRQKTTPPASSHLFSPLHLSFSHRRCAKKARNGRVGNPSEKAVKSRV